MTVTPLHLLVAIVAILLLAAAVRALLQSKRGGAVPPGTVVYSDADGSARPLVSPRRPLSGKPDYVLRTRRGAHLPIEYKSYRCGDQLPHADLLQLGAYLVLLEDLHGKPPPFGVLRYTDRSLRVPYTAALRKEVLEVLALLSENGDDLPEPTPQRDVCRPCPFAPICEAAVR